MLIFPVLYLFINFYFKPDMTKYEIATFFVSHISLRFRMIFNNIFKNLLTIRKFAPLPMDYSTSNVPTKKISTDINRNQKTESTPNECTHEKKEENETDLIHI